MTQTSPAGHGLADLLRQRIVVAPMAGGPTTTGLVIAAARAGALGFLAAGYKTPGAMAAEITAMRAERMSLWAGQGYRLAADLPAAEIIERLRG